MVSNIGTGGEGWPFIDKIGDDEGTAMCNFATAPIIDTKYPIPSVIHYCQRYIVNKFLFYKRNFPIDFFECDSAPLSSPPIDLAEGFMQENLGEDKYQEDKTKIKRNTFMLCAINSMLNDAQRFYKKHHCKS